MNDEMRKELAVMIDRLNKLDEVDNLSMRTWYGLLAARYALQSILTGTV